MSRSDDERRTASTTDADDASVVDAEVVDAEVVDEEAVEGDVADVEEFAEALGGDPAQAGDAQGSGNGQAGDQGDEVEQDLADLVEQARSERDEYLGLAQRTQADFENFRKRMATETASAKVRGRLDVVAGVIAAIDNLERTMAVENIDPDQALNGEMPADAPVSVQGVIVAYRDLHSTLRSAAVEAYNPAGEAFDPNLHEALSAMPVEGQPAGVVLEVMQLGYRTGETVIRPARVVVSQ